MERLRRVAAAADRWAKSLIDTSGNNRLLYYRDLKAGTLALTGADPMAVTRLLSGKPQTLGQLFPEAQSRSDAQRRLRNIRAKMRELSEERGLDAGYVVTGMATWREPDRTPRAPVIMHPLQIDALSATETDFRLRVESSPIVNPVLLFKLSRDYGVTIAEDELLAELPEAGFVPDALLNRLTRAASRVPEFLAAPTQVAGTFLYEKLPMVQDIEKNGEMLAASDAIAALAGDVAAGTALASPVSIPPSTPDAVPLHDEFLVLDADSSQSYAINAVVVGQHLVIKGPPGTGKSQTIANIIAALAARGRTTLFVAEKRAAIDAVLNRLASVDLDDLVVNLHGGGTSRRELAQALGSRLQRIAHERQPQLQDLGRQLLTRREQLVAHNEMLHRRHEPWGLSAYEIQDRVIGLGGGRRPAFRWRGPMLQRLNPATAEQLWRTIGELARLGAFDGSRPSSPWQASTIAAEAAVADVMAATGTAAYQILPEAQQLLRTLTSECGLRQPQSRAAWRELLRLVHDVSRSLENFAPEVYAGDLGRWLTATADRRGRKAAAVPLGWFERRAAVKEALSLWTGPVKPARDQLHAALLAVADQRSRWQRCCENGSLPREAECLPAALANADHLDRSLTVLEAILPATFTDAPERLQRQLSALASDQLGLQRVARHNELRAALLGWNLHALLADLAERRASAVEAEQALEYAWLHSILDHIALTDARYAGMNAELMTAAVADFQRADHRHIEATPGRIRRLAAAHLVATLDAQPEQQQLVRKEAAKKARHLPVRELFRAAPEVLLAVKPCWAMSPLLVSQVLPAQRLFDVVIFDEASQVEPVDGITSIMRGRQVVVAGDEHQLPPTQFFDTTEDDPVGDDDGETALTDDVESLLQAFATALPLSQNKHLAWHYRSRDERLIAFSNLHIYAPNGNELVTFPGAATEGCLAHVLVDNNPVGYGPGDRVSAEVDRVVELVLEHAETRPGESLGVITMGIKHAERVEAALRRALLDRRGIDDFFRERNDEPFFVKSIERVQGDERDAIILSVGYGKGADGRMLYRFGPINNNGGHRRLNVAVTRARQRATVVSSFSARDMDPNRLNAHGAKLLRSYLEYAESQGERLSTVDTTPALNPFEADVRDRLTAAGIPLVPQYGSSGYRIDFAAQHPDRPGEMVLAIEADGAAYHSSPTARDRDRLRQEHLERLGWRFHRIWSTAWFRNPEQEVARAKSAYETAVAEANQPTPVSRPVIPPRTQKPTESSTAPTRTMPRPPVYPGAPITEYSRRDLAVLVAWIESDGRLRTEADVIAETMQELGFRKRGSRIVAALQTAVADARGANRSR
ncbi:AAA domain-containing protein [Micromonospora cremea]|uniref:AAA domain-containing protein n=1 Tax=Micromonospora cremea TaxID=709881 RepID=UPI001356607E|nr:AAA domain-containing protein [Micromonospora cremea]